MEDLDELLADLESTSNQLKASKPPSEATPHSSRPPPHPSSQSPSSPIYSEIQNGNIKVSKNASRFPTEISQPEPLYEPQQRQIPSGDRYIYAQPHATQNNNSSSSSSSPAGFSQANFTYSSAYVPKSAASTTPSSYSASPPPKPARHRSPVAPSPQQGTAFTYPEAYNNKTYQSTKMANLSELDSLLKDLETAQFQIQNTPTAPGPTHSSPSKGPPPAVAPKPKKSGRGPNADYTNGQRHITPAGPAPGMTSYLQATTVEVQHSAAPQAPAQPLMSGSLPPQQQQHQPNITQPPPRSASSATRELDDLMASLSDFQLSSSQPASPAPTPIPTKAAEPNYAQPHKLTATTQETVHASQAGQVHAPPPTNQQQQQQPSQAGMQQQGGEPARGNQLDSMLGHLQTDMNRQGVTTVAKGACAACEKQIVGQIVTALGQTWHPEHFVCHHCQGELGTQNFFERESRAYCEKDYHELFSPRCAYCNGAILDKCVTAMDKTWHPEHFFCAQCGRPFGDDGFHEKNGKPYCKDDYFDMFAPKCGGCQRPIMENYITALNVQWHAECFVCGECRTPFNGSSFFDHGGIPYCEIHYHAVRGSLCSGCNKPITGRCITAMQRKFHPEHFICAFCLKQLNKGTFKEQNDKPYCHACFVRLFS